MGPQSVLLTLCLLILLSGCFAESPEDLVVSIEQGKLRGTKLLVPNHDTPTYAFLDIPFAAPPTGDLRFAPPVPAESWEGIRDATRLGLPCPQMLNGVKQVFVQTVIKEPTATSEDCLHLNIYTPALQGARAVMVFIHGGGFYVGSADVYDGRVMALYEDVVVVIIQYRLSALGFFSTGDDVIPGNMAIQDQIHALKWVQGNIAHFGGDPQQVTIYGESAGAISVSVLLLSPESAGLFQRAIIQSGSAINTILVAPQQHMKNLSLQLATELNYSVGKLYVYYFKQRPSVSHHPAYIVTDHTEDLYFTFGMPVLQQSFGLPLRFSEDDKSMALLAMKYWANFAKTRDPNGDSLVSWPSFRHDDSYLVLKTEPVSGRAFQPEHTAFWVNVLPELIASETSAACTIVRAPPLNQLSLTIISMLVYIYLHLPHVAVQRRELF